MQYSPAVISNTTNRLQVLFDVKNLPGTNLEALHYKLARVVQHLLQSDLSRLLHILYRIDVEERQVKEAMIADDPEIIAERIARLIIKRELQKTEIRQRYSR